MACSVSLVRFFLVLSILDLDIEYCRYYLFIIFKEFTIQHTSVPTNEYTIPARARYTEQNNQPPCAHAQATLMTQQ